MKSETLYTFYLGIVSFVSVVVISISLGVSLNYAWKYYFISDKEYASNERNWEVRECRNEYEWNEEAQKSIKKVKTKQEIKKCEEEAKKAIIDSRYYDLKNTFISTISTIIVFLILFIFHYPKFLKIRK